MRDVVLARTSDDRFSDFRLDDDRTRSSYVRRETSREPAAPPQIGFPKLAEKIALLRATIARKAIFHKNIFIAKKRDSESARSIFCPLLRSAFVFNRSLHRSRCDERKHWGTVVSLMFGISLHRRFQVIAAVVSHSRCNVGVVCLRCELCLWRKHFLKRDTVFLIALV